MYSSGVQFTLRIDWNTVSVRV